MKLFSALLLATFVFAACDTVEQPTEAGATRMDKRTQVQDAISGTFTDCCGNEFTIEGTIHRNYEQIINEDGSMSLKYHGNWQGGEGTGATGQKYRAVGSATQMQSVDADGNGQFSIVHHEKFVATGKGPGCTTGIKFIQRGHFDGDGNFVIDHESMEIICD